MKTGNKGRVVAAGAFVVNLLVLGCSDDESSVSAPAQACMDTADALADAAQRCGLDYQVNYDAFVDAVASGNCGNIIAVRDESSLRGVCIPTLRNLSCDDLNSSTLALPPECMQQLQRRG